MLVDLLVYLADRLIVMVSLDLSGPENSSAFSLPISQRALTQPGGQLNQDAPASLTNTLSWFCAAISPSVRQ
jgi:hypothetical protein